MLIYPYINTETAPFKRGEHGGVLCYEFDLNVHEGHGFTDLLGCCPAKTLR